MFPLKLRSLLSTLFVLFVFCNGATSVNAQETIVYIDPLSLLIPQVGETFSINVSISDVTNLFGYDFILWYNTTMLDCLGVEWPEGHFLTPTLKPTNIFKVKTIENNFNETTGAVRVVTTLLDGEPPKNGSGILVMITFNTTTTDGPSPLKLYWPGFLYPVKLSDPNGNPIPCSATDGEVTVIPEFSSLSPILWLIIATLTITLLGKRQRNYRHKNHFQRKTRHAPESVIPPVYEKFRLQLPVMTELGAC